jgi:predicted XRE-type DNA-binding protein
VGAGQGQETAVIGKLKYVRGSDNIFLDLGFSKVEAANLKLRSELMIRIEQAVRSGGMSRAEVARALVLTQSRLNALLKGKIGQFSLDALVDIAIRAGQKVRLEVTKSAPTSYSPKTVTTTLRECAARRCS